MKTLTLSAVPNQTFKSVLSGQQVGIRIYLLADEKLYIDVELNDAPVVVGVLLRNNVKVVRNTYLGFSGDFVITDTQGTSDPEYSGLGARWKLVYMTATEADND